MYFTKEPFVFIADVLRPVLDMGPLTGKANILSWALLSRKSSLAIYSIGSDKSLRSARVNNSIYRALAAAEFSHDIADFYVLYEHPVNNGGFLGPDNARRFFKYFFLRVAVVKIKQRVPYSFGRSSGLGGDLIYDLHSAYSALAHNRGGLLYY